MLPLLFFLIASCGKTISLAGLDQTVWTSDKLGCKGERLQYADIFQDSQEQLLRLNQNEIEKLLGLPDEHELDARKRKYFFYYLEPGQQCGFDNSYPIRLSIKFSAMGVSTEVFLENF